MGKKTIEIERENDIEQINLVQYLNSDENLYFNQDFSENYIDNFIGKHKHLRREEKVVTKEFPDQEDKLKSYMLQHDVDIRCNLKLSFIGLLMKAQRNITNLRKDMSLYIPRSPEVADLADRLQEGEDVFETEG